MNICMIPVRKGSERLAKKNYLKIDRFTVLEIALNKNNNHQKTNLFLGEMFKKMNMREKGWFHKHKATGLIRFSKNGLEFIG